MYRVQVLDVRRELQRAEPPWLAFGVRNIKDYGTRVFAARRAAAFELLAGYGLQPDVCNLRPLGDQLQLPANRIRLDVPEVYRQERHVQACYGSDFRFEVLAMVAIHEGDLQCSDRQCANRARRGDRADQPTAERAEATRPSPLLSIGHAFKALPRAVAQSRSRSARAADSSPPGRLVICPIVTIFR